MKRLGIALVIFTLVFAIASAGLAMGPRQDKKAIVIACFGTTYPSALVAITNIQNQVKKAFPGVKVKLAFTSNIIRNIWHNRQGDDKFFSQHKDIPRDIVYVKGPLATIADLQDEGYRTIIVQPTHIYAGEEYADLTSYVEGLNSIKTIKAKYMPFKKLVLGRPLLGKPGAQYDYHEDFIPAAKALAGDVAMARKNYAALVYMGHGNEFYSTGVYIEFQQAMRKMYPDIPIFIGTVEGFPSLADVVRGLTHVGVKKMVLKPFMIVAGDHANNDMAGNDSDSWKMVIKSKGIKVITVIHGLGENNDIANIFVQHIRDVAKDNNIEL
ncbi:MAG: sirohydrochlorin cobaltochelatase [Deltaproteobacteria bacterium]|nr:sirohydrochlorin cobaltochelatase [Deltaproteobacteria bacterium]MBW1929989.1 sirohydrochlorin cobaltochelatase [Deltaproteobacteria bacterium]MBW2027077.1 sirohydrochlorin cobaltochelatase [Deltaproteobacteria bacterium]